jgi:hypothetical protein
MPQCIIPPCIIEDGCSKSRIALFTGTKKSVMDKSIGYKKEISSITYSVRGFLSLLGFVADLKRKYDGMRVYFASYLNDEGNPDSELIPAGQEDNLTLIFVPTRTIFKNSIKLHQDDIDNCLVIVNDHYQNLLTPRSDPRNPDTASDWIRNFQQSRIPDLENDGVSFTGNAYFKETRSTWYSIETFSLPGKPDLITYINCLWKDPDNPLVSIIARFAGYIKTDAPFPFYQLTLVFDLHQKNDGVVIDSAFGSQKSGSHEPQSKDHFTFAPADTGLPCPPDVGCQSGASRLPAS